MKKSTAATVSENKIYEYALHGQLYELHILMDGGCFGFVNVRDKKNGMTPLHWAANGGKLECMKLLLEHGADVNVTDSQDNITALHIVCARGFSACAQLLLDHLANVNALSNRTESPLHVACWAGHAPCVHMLLQAGALVNIKDAEFGDSPLHQATSGGHLQCVHMLITHNAALNMRNRRGWTPLHCAAANDHLECFQKLLEAGADVTVRGLDNKRLFSHFKSKKCRDAAILSTEFTIEQLSSQHYDLWFYLLRLTHVVGLEARIQYLTTKFPALVRAVDAAGRSATEVASPANKLELQASTLWHGRFRVIGEFPEHVSSSTIIFRAIDEQAKSQLVAAIDGKAFALDSKLEAPETNFEFALKFMRTKSQFARELLTRQAYQFHFDYVMDVVMSNPPADSQLSLYPDVLTIDMSVLAEGTNTPQVKQIVESMYCVVMPFANRTLLSWLTSEYALGHGQVSVAQTTRGLSGSVVDIRLLFLQILEAVEYLHVNGLVHGDLKPQNIVFHNNRWKLIDLDAVCSIGSHYVDCEMTSSAVLPPEGIYIRRRDVLTVNGEDQPAGNSLALVTVGTEFESPVKVGSSRSLFSAHVRGLTKHALQTQSQSQSQLPDRGNPALKAIPSLDTMPDFEMLVAHPSYDVWSLGCVMFQLSSNLGAPLFACTKRDQLITLATEFEGQTSHDPLLTPWNDDSLWAIASWRDPVKKLKLRRVNDPLVRNLLSQMLSRDWMRRPSIARVAAHPFLSLRNVPRLVGEQPVYDVFLSHRGSSDDPLASSIYNQLTSRGVRVYWSGADSNLDLGLEKSVSYERGMSRIDIDQSRPDSSHAVRLFGSEKDDEVNANDYSNNIHDTIHCRDDYFAALANAHIYIPILSRSSINNSFSDNCNFSILDSLSDVDTMLLEFRLALELQNAGMLISIVPVLAGDLVRRPGASAQYSSYFEGDCCPLCRHEAVASVENHFVSIIESLGLGPPNIENQTIHDTLGTLLGMTSSVLLEGPREYASERVVDAALAQLAEIELQAGLVSSGVGAAGTGVVGIVEGNDQHNNNNASQSRMALNLLASSPVANVDVQTNLFNSGDISSSQLSNLLQAMTVEIKTQKDENRSLRQQLLPVLDREQKLISELTRTKSDSSPQGNSSGFPRPSPVGKTLLDSTPDNMKAGYNTPQSHTRVQSSGSSGIPLPSTSTPTPGSMSFQSTPQQTNAKLASATTKVIFDPSSMIDDSIRRTSAEAVTCTTHSFDAFCKTLRRALEYI